MISGFLRGVNDISLFWDFTQRRLVVSYRQIGTTDRSPSLGVKQSTKTKLLDP
jgi:hypothetical protein